MLVQHVPTWKSGFPEDIRLFALLETQWALGGRYRVGQCSETRVDGWRLRQGAELDGLKHSNERVIDLECGTAAGM